MKSLQILVLKHGKPIMITWMISINLDKLIRYAKQRDEVVHEKAVVLKSYIDYFNYLNNHT